MSRGGLEGAHDASFIESGAMAEKKKLGEILQEMGAVTDEQVHRALLEARKKKLRIGEALVQLGFTTERHVARALCRQVGLPFVDLEKGKLSQTAIEAIPAEVVREHRIVPVKKAADAWRRTKLTPLVSKIFRGYFRAFRNT